MVPYNLQDYCWYRKKCFSLSNWFPVQPGTGAGLEMDAIGGVFVGGVAATCGYGSVIGTFVGIFVIMLLKTGLPYVGLQANWQQIITGLVLIVAVLIDIIKEKKKAAM